MALPGVKRNITIYKQYTLFILAIMNKIITLFFFSVLTLALQAQTLRFGCFSYAAALSSMPEYATAKGNLDKLKAQYDAEMKRVSDDFNAKYEDFLDSQRTLAAPILSKRQAELEELMGKNLAFKQEAARLLKQAEDDAMKPLRARLDATIKRVGQERGYAFILNTDNNACPYFDTTMGEDITTIIKDALR